MEEETEELFRKGGKVTEKQLCVPAHLKGKRKQSQGPSSSRDCLFRKADRE